ncbi:hypothetical protein AALO_G00148150 [Alosa alosa]|uniref:Uncharacterized protein n=1 Tax=Alosa alosa TaxID=278164 RepID=A0AAV6GEB3_9TELE|nr:hypothetical protein AALO_G00148150 [Alosa alosa]
MKDNKSRSFAWAGSFQCWTVVTISQYVNCKASAGIQKNLKTTLPHTTGDSRGDGRRRRRILFFPFFLFLSFVLIAIWNVRCFAFACNC